MIFAVATSYLLPPPGTYIVVTVLRAYANLAPMGSSFTTLAEFTSRLPPLLKALDMASSTYRRDSGRQGSLKPCT